METPQAAVIRFLTESMTVSAAAPPSSGVLFSMAPIARRASTNLPSAFLITSASLTFEKTFDCTPTRFTFEAICLVSAVSSVPFFLTAALHDTVVAVPAPDVASFCESSLFGCKHPDVLLGISDLAVSFDMRCAVLYGSQSQPTPPPFLSPQFHNFSVPQKFHLCNPCKGASLNS